MPLRWNGPSVPRTPWPTSDKRCVMETYRELTRMENVLNEYTRTLEDMEALLTALDGRRKDYKDLLAYYYSDQRRRDLEDDERGLIPADLPRGVLSEDGIYDFLGDYRDTALHMMETALHMLKED